MSALLHARPVRIWAALGLGAMLLLLLVFKITPSAAVPLLAVYLIVFAVYHRAVEEEMAARRAGEARFEAQYRHNPVPVLTWRSVIDDWQLIDANIAAERFLGRPADELRGIWFSEFSLGQSDLHEAVVRCAAERRPIHVDLPYRVRPGEDARQIAFTCVSAPPDLVMVHAEDVTERTAHEQRLRHQAMHDPLTGLPNRMLFDDRLNQAFEAAHRDGTALSVLFLDLDGFKDVNDTRGHQCGDRALEEVARRLQGALRKSDTVARLGGDEFAVLLPGCGENGAVLTAAKLMDGFTQPCQVDQEVLQIGASIGVAAYLGPHDEPAQLVRRADAAMYRAKGSRSGIVIAPQADVEGSTATEYRGVGSP